MDDREERVRARAYALWQADGMPEGREQDHWVQAEREIEGEEPSEITLAADRGPAPVEDGATETIGTVSEVPIVRKKRASPRAKK